MAAKPTQAPKKKIFLVDDHPVVRQGLSLVLNAQPDLTVCGEADDAEQALQKIPPLRPDIALVDLSLKGRDGLDLIKDLKLRFETMPVLVISMLDENFYAERALRAGAKGYVMKQEATDKLLAAVRKVLAGEIYVSAQTMNHFLSQVAGDRPKTAESPIQLLSNRELTVFRLTGKGYSTNRIAQELHLSVKTVETHKMHIKEKLNLKDSAELMQHAVKYVCNDNFS